MSKELLQHTHYVSFELSNICNNSMIHIRCPLHYEREKIILPYNLIIETLRFLGQSEFKGMIGFNVYNEPLIDPRLFKLIEVTRNVIPQSIIFILTNGFYLNQQMIFELFEFEVNRIQVSSYKMKDYERLSNMNIPEGLEYEIIDRQLDDRLSVYTREINNFKEPCYAPLGQIMIASTGDILLCCLDFEHRHVFGNLHKQSLYDILNDGKMLQVRNELINGIRNYEMCKRCGWSR